MVSKIPCTSVSLPRLLDSASVISSLGPMANGKWAGVRLSGPTKRGSSQRSAANDCRAAPVKWPWRPHVRLSSSSPPCRSVGLVQHGAGRSLTGTARSQDGGGRRRRLALPYRGAHRRAPQRRCSGREATGELGKVGRGTWELGPPSRRRLSVRWEWRKGRRPVAVQLSSPRSPRLR